MEADSPEEDGLVKLNHVNLPVRDVTATRDFFVKYFDLEVQFNIPNVMALLGDGSGMVLNVCHFNKAETEEVHYHKDFHVGFLVDSAAEVDAAHARLVAGGLDVESPKRRQGGRYGFYYPAPGGFEVEVEWLGKFDESRKEV